MHKPFFMCVMYLSILSSPVGAEQFRTLVGGMMPVSSEKPEGVSLNLASNGSAIISLEKDTRFLRGVELELSAPQAWLLYRGSLAMIIYNDFVRLPALGINDLDGKRIIYEPLPNKIKTVYQIPLRPSHGLRSDAYATVISSVTLPEKFPILFRLMPIIKGINDELENMRFDFIVRPILGNEGAVKLIPRFPDQLKGKPFTVLIDDVLVENPSEEILLKEGEHHLVVLSGEYRNESRRFIVEKAKVLDLIINLQDPTPLIIFEGPENARIYLNNNQITRGSGPIPVEPGVHEARFHVGDYTLTKTITVQRGKTYRVALSVGINIEENE